jgi:dolichyl-phosphate-mannose--protein O-mannosyl transferase
MAIKTPRRIRKDFEIKAGFTQSDVKGVILGLGVGLMTSLIMVSFVRLIWIGLSLILSLWLMLPSKEVRKLKHWQVLFLLLRRPVVTYIVERDARKEEHYRNEN